MESANINQILSTYFNYLDTNYITRKKTEKSHIRGHIFLVSLTFIGFKV